MRHRIQGRRLGRDMKHRKALRKNLVADLLCYEQVMTTEAKARMLQPAAEKMITLAKRGLAKAVGNPAVAVNARRLAASRLPQLRTITDEEGKLVEVDVVKKLFSEIAPRYTSRPGGYTRLVKVGRRPGDNSEMAVVMLVDGDESAPAGASAA